jgi:hypothetical protein
MAEISETMMAERILMGWVLEGGYLKRVWFVKYCILHIENISC